MEKYSWSFLHDDIFNGGADSVKDCLALAKAEADDEETVYIGENIAFVPIVDEEWVLDDLQEQACNFCGELGDGWDAYDYKTMKTELEDLSTELTAITMAWLKKHGREPNFYRVENVRPYSISGSEKKWLNGTTDD